MRFVEQREQALDNRGAALVAGDGTELGGGDAEHAAHGAGISSFSASASTTWSNTLAPATRSAGAVCSAGL